MVWIARVFAEQRPRIKEENCGQQYSGAAVASVGGSAGDDDFLDPKEVAQDSVGVPENNEFFLQFKEAKERERLEMRQRDWERYEEEARQLRRDALEKHNADALLLLHSLKAPRKNFTRGDVPSFLLRQKFQKDASFQVGEEVANDPIGLLPPESPLPLTYPPVQLRHKDKKPSRVTTHHLSALLVPLRPALDAIASNEEATELAKDIPAGSAVECSSREKMKAESPRRHMAEVNDDLIVLDSETPRKIADIHPSDLQTEPRTATAHPSATVPHGAEEACQSPSSSSSSPLHFASQAPAAPNDVEGMLHEQQLLQQRLADISAALAINQQEICSKCDETRPQDMPTQPSGNASADVIIEQEQQLASSENDESNGPAPVEGNAIQVGLNDEDARPDAIPEVGRVDEGIKCSKEQQVEMVAVHEAELSDELPWCDIPTEEEVAGDDRMPSHEPVPEDDEHRKPETCQAVHESCEEDCDEHEAPEESSEPDDDEEIQPMTLNQRDTEGVSHEEAYFRARLVVTEAEYLRDLYAEEEHRRLQVDIASTRQMAEQGCETTPRLYGAASPEQIALTDEEEFLRVAITAMERQAAEALLQRVEDILEEHTKVELASPKRTEKIQKQIFMAEQDALALEENSSRMQIIGEYNDEIVDGVAAVFNRSMLFMSITEEEFTCRLQLSMMQSTYLTFIRRFVRYIHTSEVISMGSQQVRENIFQFATGGFALHQVAAPAVSPFDVLDAQEHADRRVILRRRQVDEQAISRCSRWLLEALGLEASSDADRDSLFAIAAQQLLLDTEPERRRTLRQQRLELFDRHADEQEELTLTCMTQRRGIGDAYQTFRTLMFSGLSLVCSHQLSVDSFVSRASREYHVFSEFAAQQLTKHHERSVRLIGKEVDSRNNFEAEEAFERSIYVSFLQLYTFKLFLVQDIFVDSCQRTFDESSERIVETIQRIALRNSLRKALAEGPAPQPGDQLRAPPEESLPAHQETGNERFSEEPVSKDEEQGSTGGDTMTMNLDATIKSPPLDGPASSPADPFHQEVFQGKERIERLRIERSAEDAMGVVFQAGACFLSHIQCEEQFSKLGAILFSRVFTDGIQLALLLHQISKRELETRGLLEYDCLLFFTEFLRVVSYVYETEGLCDVHATQAAVAYDAAVAVEDMKTANHTAVGREVLSRNILVALEEHQREDYVRLHHVLFSRCVLFRVVQGKMKSCYLDIGTFLVDSVLMSTPSEEAEKRAEIESAEVAMIRGIFRCSNLLVAIDSAAIRWMKSSVDVFFAFAAERMLSSFVSFGRQLELETTEAARRTMVEAESAAFARPVINYGDLINALQLMSTTANEAITLAHRTAFASVLDAATRRVKMAEEHKRQRCDFTDLESEARAVLEAEEGAHFVSGAQRYKRYIEAVVAFEKKCVSLKITFCEQFETKVQQLQRKATNSDMRQSQGELRRKNTMATLASVPSMNFSTHQRSQRSASVAGASLSSQMALSELHTMPPALRDNGVAICEGNPGVTSLCLRSLDDALTERVVENLVAILEVRALPLGSVDLSGNSATLPKLLPSLAKLFRLVTELNLSACGLEAEHEALIVSSLSDPSTSLVTLRSLLLDNNNLSSAFPVSVGRVLRNTNFVLTKLSLAGNTLISQNNQRLVQFLCDTNRFDKAIKAKILALEMKDKSADADFGAQSRTSVDGGVEFVRTLDDIAGRCVCVTLSGNEYCSKVSLRGQKLTDRSATLFALLLRTNSALSHVDLSHNFLSDKGLRELAGALQTNTTLVELRLEGNQFSDVATLTQVADKCKRNAHEVLETSTFSARERNGT